MKCANSRQSVIKRRGNEEEASNVIKEEEIITSVIVKNENYICDIATLKTDKGFKLHNNDPLAEEEKLYVSPVQNLIISQAKAAISKLFDDSTEDWHHKNRKHSIYGVKEDVDIAFRPTLSNGFSPSEQMKSTASPNVINSTIYPVHLLPRDLDVQEHAEMSDMKVLEASYCCFDNPMLPIKAGIPWSSYQDKLPRKTFDNIVHVTTDGSRQSECEKKVQGDINNNASPGKFNFGKKEHIRVVENNDGHEKPGDHIHPIVCCVDGCDKTFSKRVHLTAHIRVHNGKRPFRCEWSHCGKSFTRPCELKRHEWVHTKPGRFYCNACGKKFSRADHLKMHKNKCKALS